MNIITHRWLEPLNLEFKFTESSSEAFENHLYRWYWIEFDINKSKDNKYFIFHDKWFSRISKWKNNQFFNELDYFEIKKIGKDYWINFILFEDLVWFIIKFHKNNVYSALHLKSTFQDKSTIDYIVWIFNKYDLYEKIFIFDVKIDTAKYIKSIDKNIKLYPSVAHNYDIERYNKYTWWTLLSLLEVIANKDLFDWVWLDEWDRKNSFGNKKFYSNELFNKLKKLWLKISLVTPELHGKSPWLLWWEIHEDSLNEEILINRINEIKSLNPDYICSDNIQFI